MKLKEVLKYNRTAGIIALILVVLLSVFADANMALNAERKDVRKAYKNADFPTLIEKCADEMRLLCKEADKLGIYVTRGVDAADALEACRKKPDGSYDALTSVYANAVSIGNEIITGIHNDDEETSRTVAAALKHYDSLGQQLYYLSVSPDYNKEAAEYNKESARPLCRLLAPWFGEAPEYDALFERYREKFPNIKTENPTDISVGIFDELIESLGSLSGNLMGLVGKILAFAIKIIAAIVSWFAKHFVVAAVVLVIIIGGIINSKKN
ncbi:MAG: hypothetical protein MJ137_01555 [Clostridia bacterium]|nr:hypothetical protein [Clostridia bacterium]